MDPRVPKKETSPSPGFWLISTMLVAYSDWLFWGFFSAYGQFLAQWKVQPQILQWEIQTSGPGGLGHLPVELPKLIYSL